jgi:MoaA/NifB/PqqE/SkfB family radical SAM enzyme
MRRIINQINVSITTNRTCTLRCTHCYIAPHLFDDKSQMSEKTFRLIFDRVEELYERDANLEEIEWEAIGGETTMMPFEWWERQLPWALDRIAQINTKLRSPGSLNFLTNLIYSDQRYTGLLNEYADHPAFALYTSWEPDTERFGKRNQLFNKFYKTLTSLTAKNKILDIILTKEIIAMGAEKVLELFVPAGITDFSMKMISPYGSGKAFFEPNMTDFQSMTQFFRDMNRLKPAHVTFTPQEEMLSSLYKGGSFQCNGNFKYDLSIEPDGSCHFNANQTGDEATVAFRTLTIDDPRWATKLCFENKTEENNKLSLSHPECDQCEYMHYCNAGWYHYKIADPKVIDLYRKDECAGYKAFWKDNAQYLGNQVIDRSSVIHRQTLRELMAGRAVVPCIESVPESSLPAPYKDYFAVIDSVKAIDLDQHVRFGKNLLERAWFYEDLQVKTTVNESILSTTPFIDKLVEHVVYGNYRHMSVSDAWLQGYLRTAQSTIARRLNAAIGLITGAITVVPEAGDLVVDARHEELFRFAYHLARRLKQPMLDVRHPYLSQLLENIHSEEGFNVSV